MTFQLGSSGPEVSQIQTQLQTLGFFNGMVDGNFGSETQTAVMQFQSAQNLTADGVVGPQTWAALFGSATPISPSTGSSQSGGSLAYRCLSLTGAFETGLTAPGCFAVMAGDGDGQGMSFGVLQWNLGQGTLQPMLLQMDQMHSDIIDSLFGNNAIALRQMLTAPLSRQLSWARSIQDSSHRIQPPWHDQFSALGFTDEYQQLEVAGALNRFNAALSWCPTYGIHTERAVALMFDINVQNGSILPSTQALILQDFQVLRPTGDPSQDEVNRLVIIANRRADDSSLQHQADVRARKLCIANGQGTVHGKSYDLQSDFGITLNNAV